MTRTPPSKRPSSGPTSSGTDNATKPSKKAAAMQKRVIAGKIFRAVKKTSKIVMAIAEETSKSSASQKESTHKSPSKK